MLQLRQRPRHQALVQGRAAAQRTVHALADQVHRAVIEADLQFDLRIARGKLRQRRYHQQPADAHRHIDTQQATGVVPGQGERRLTLLQVRQQAYATLVIGGSVQGRADLAGGAVQQLHPQMGLQLLDQNGHRRRRHLQTVGSLGKAAQLDDTGKDAHGVETIHGANLRII